jgi:hypothetical protein
MISMLAGRRWGPNPAYALRGSFIGTGNSAFACRGLRSASSRWRVAFCQPVRPASSGWVSSGSFARSVHLDDVAVLGRPTPAAIIDTLNREINSALDDPNLKTRLVTSAARC